MNSNSMLHDGQLELQTPSSESPLRRLHNATSLRLKVLYVEDDPELLECTRIGLEERGFDVCAVPDGVEAFNALRREDFDVILLDLGIPGMRGSKFMHEVRRNGDIPATPVVILSGADEQHLQKAAGLGAFEVHRKPARATDVARALRSAAYYG